ncbi:hypothetical protein [Miltoncostaea oceani]|uniref:hypothetical protein n=1 Tax=Miltoncostaea oceani TaxID=2843216 RepID=UPI001C3D7D84|nr:hypothetical protein [Miltoncostaea oceani]
MRRRVTAACAAVLVVLAVACGTALGYGTSTTYASQSAGTPPGTWAGLAGAGSASDADAAATLTETDAGGVAATSYPSNRTFATNAAGWTPADTSAVLCSASSAHDAGTGSPAGSIRTTYATLLNLAGLLAACGSTWTSPSFTWSGGTPAAVAFSMDRMVDANGLVGVVTTTWQVVLVDETAPGTKVLVSGSASADTPWGTVTSATVGPSDIVSGHTYHLRIDSSFSSVLSLVGGLGVNYDDVTLDVTPRASHADGELRVTSVPAGTTHTLEMRARTSGESFTAQVWDGTTWTPWTTVSGASYATASLGLTAAQRNGGTVRVRFAATGTGADATADVLSVEYLRVVATGGASVSGPTSVTLPPVAIDPLAPAVSSGPLGTVEVVDGGGAASGWELRATATRWVLDGAPAQMLPADAFTATPAAPTTPDGSDMTGVWAGAGGTFHTSTPIVLMGASPGAGIGTFRENPSLSLTIPVTALSGVYRCDITLSAS